MALTERSRSALFRGLSEVLDDEEAVGELLSYFPGRDVDEPASRDFVDARITAVEAKVAGVDARVSAIEARMDAGFSAVDARFAGLEARMEAGFSAVDARASASDARMAAGFAEVRSELMSAMHAEIRTMTQWTVGSIVAVVGLLVVVGLIR